MAETIPTLPDPRIKDMTGQQIGRWFVVGYAGRKYWHCRCNCGTESKVRGVYLRTGRSVSCGCFRVDSITTHGRTRFPEHRIWKLMKQRCENPNDEHFPRYGARGIRIEWTSFEEFYRDMGPRPSPKHSIERRNNNSNYSAKNCRWATKKEQANNRRTNRFLTHNNKTLTIAQWAELLKVTPNTLYSRLACGWPVERILNPVVRHY